MHKVLIGSEYSRMLEIIIFPVVESRTMSLVCKLVYVCVDFFVVHVFIITGW